MVERKLGLILRVLLGIHWKQVEKGHEQSEGVRSIPGEGRRHLS
jgi:hypothetical protein